MSIFGAEEIGTALLILLGNGVVAGVLLNLSKAQNSGWIVITFGWGLGVMTAVFAIGQFSGAHLNPAVTFGFAIAESSTGAMCPSTSQGSSSARSSARRSYGWRTSTTGAKPRTPGSSWPATAPRRRSA